MDKYKESFHVPKNMTTTSGMDHIDYNSCVHDCGGEHSSLSLIE